MRVFLGWKFVGYKLSSEGISPSPGKVESIQNMPLPQTVEHRHSFLSADPR